MFFAVITITSRPTGTPVYGQSVELQCQVLGACADFGTTWYHRSYNSNGELTFRTLPDVQTTKTSSNQYSYINIANYGESDDGIYNCKVDLFGKPIVSPDALVIGGKFHSAMQSKNAVCALIKYSRYFHYTYNFT